MKRIVLVATTLALGMSIAAAESPIAARQALMKKNGDAAKLGTQFMKGEAPFDLAKAKAIFATLRRAWRSDLSLAIARICAGHTSATRTFPPSHRRAC